MALANKEMKVMMRGAFVLTAASFVAKILSAIYRVPYQNLAGDEGFYVYQQVYPIYGIAMTLALSGLPQFISKYVAEKNGPREQRAALTELFPLVTGLGLILWAITFFGSRQIANGMGDARLASLIQVVSFTFVLMPLLSITRGEFQGKLMMVPTAVSQVVEQLIRVGVILIAAWSFQQFHWNVYHTGTVAMAGALAGGIAAVLILQYYRRKVLGTSTPIVFLKCTDRSKTLIKRLILEGGLMTVYSGYLILFQLIDSFTIKKALVDSGLTEYGAKVAKGVYDRGQPLVQLGLVAALALSSSFLPVLTRYLAKHDRRLFIKSSQIFLRLTCGVAAAASLGLVLLLPYVNFALFKDYSGNLTLVLFVFSIFLMAMIQSYQSIAQSQNRYQISLQAAGWGLLLKVLTTDLFTRVWGTVGASIATLAGLTVALIVLHRGSDSAITNYLKERKFGKKLTVCLGGMVISLFGYYTVLSVLGNPVQHRSQALFVALLGVLIGASMFLFLSIRLKLLTTREWLMLPMGSKILRLKWRGK
ncbi:PST family polysaccharide transporter [Enterococcus sp. 665A]|uniref:PST family polysaccharide transporter n=1 Tax=Candidatus Enterococcus ferrettii TaxID=2815324 RepID=A0ABV0ELB3_9ENTE